MRDKFYRVASEFGLLFRRSEVPDDFLYEGQDFIDRCEGWLLHAIDQLENELAAFRDDQSEHAEIGDE